MSWRTVVISSRAKLEYKLNYLLIRNEAVTKIFLNEIAVLLIESTAVSLTTSLISELTKRKIKVIFCDEKRNPVSELIPCYGCHDEAAKLRIQLAWTPVTKEMVWTEIVRNKIHQQKCLLLALNREEAKLLGEYQRQLQIGDTTNREGHAAKVYFNALFGKEFSRNDDTPVNAALNYGYSIILSTFNREIVANGYLTQLGLFHDNTFNHFNLSCDFMEPFRPLVDQIVLAMALNDFSSAEKLTLVNLLNQSVIIDGKQQYINNAIKIYCKSLFVALEERDPALIHFYKNEL